MENSPAATYLKNEQGCAALLGGNLKIQSEHNGTVVTAAPLPLTRAAF
jgi:signal transduction histidine kinase